MTKTYVATVVIAGGLTISVANAQWPVIDVASIARLVEQINEIKRHIRVAVDTYIEVERQRRQLEWNARMIFNKNRWKRSIMSWRYPYPSNQYGRTGTWSGAIRDGNRAREAWLESAAQWPDYLDVWSDIPAPQQKNIGSHAASLELADAAGINTLATLGDVRAKGQDTERAIDELERDSLSDSPELNTEVSVLNKINGATLLALRNQQEQNRLLASITEHALLTSKMQRDAMVESFANDAAIRRLAGEQHARHFGGTTSALRGLILR